MVQHGKTFQENLSNNTFRVESTTFEARLLSEGLCSWAFVFVFLRILGIVRASRTLGPLQVTLIRMVVNVAQFLAIFLLILIAFALGLSEVFWYFGTAEGVKEMCSSSDSIEQCEKDYAFGGIEKNLISLFWSLFGVVEQGNFISPGGIHTLTEDVGLTLFATYNVLAIIVLINMLIAMMSKTYEETSDNEEIVWKFQQTRLWIRVIKKEQVRPPPMNLIPSLYWIQKRWGEALKQQEESEPMNEELGEVTVGLSKDDITKSDDVCVDKKQRILRKLARRYRYKVLSGRGKTIKSSR